MPEHELFTQGWTPVTLYAKDEPDNVLVFPSHAMSGTLPRLVTVESPETGRRLIAATDWWGKPGTNPEATAVRARVTVLRALERPGESPSTTNKVPVKVRKATLSDLILYRRGFVTSIGLTVIVALAAIGGAIVGFLSSTTLLGWGAVVLCLFCVVELWKAVTDLKKLGQTA